MNVYKAIKLLSFRNVTSQDADAEYILRKIFRWYSKTFYTPLHTIPDLPLEDVLQAYYECHYEELNLDQLEEERKLLIITPEEEEETNKQKDANAAESFEFMKEVEEEEKAKAKPSQSKTISDTPIESKQSGLVTPVESKPQKEHISPIELLPDIVMQFEELNDFLESDALGIFEKKDK